MSYQIIPLLQGYAENTDKSVLVYRHAFGDKYRLPNGFFLIRGNGENILVDTGTATNEEIAAMNFTQLAESRSFEEVLAAEGVDPLSITKVIMTHLHWDHCWNLNKLPNAKVYVQKRELTHAMSPYPPERRSFGYIDGYTDPHWLAAASQIVPLEGDTEILPGLRVITTGGHTYGGQSVLVDTAQGTYAIVGDFVLILESMDTGIPLGLFVSQREWYEGYHKLKSLDLAGILPTHDLITYEHKIYG